MSSVSKAPAINDDFTQFVTMNTEEMEWQPSPSPQVWRKRLELSGPAESGRVTSIVRYEPGSRFPSHKHPEGEEFLVLEGTFCDERGEYPAGTFVLNPDGSEHAPFSPDGCQLFVKLRQYPGRHRPRVVIDSKTTPWESRLGGGAEVLDLYYHEKSSEHIELFRIPANTEIQMSWNIIGAEVLVLEGEFGDGKRDYSRGAWIRYPPPTFCDFQTATGCTLYIKSGPMGGPLSVPTVPL